MYNMDGPSFIVANFEHGNLILFGLNILAVLAIMVSVWRSGGRPWVVAPVCDFLFGPRRRD